ncbi:hypothetical protein DBR46_03650 [Pseudomonas sp. KBW05]|nr:hypothetical protein DBR46_03650 [Pseudomonas sp. KBW05]
MWERACSRRRCDSQCIRRLTQRFREQARSHIRYVLWRKMRHNPNPRHKKAPRRVLFLCSLA